MRRMVWVAVAWTQHHLADGGCGFVFPPSKTTTTRRGGGEQGRQKRSGRLGARRAPDLEIEHDAVIIGSGIGGLSAAAVLASEGKKVCVLEAHEHLGGAAHEWSHFKGYRFENGPSLYTGLASEGSPNPLKHVFQICGEEPEWIKYDRWGTEFEGDAKFAAAVGSEDFLGRILPEYGGPDAVEQWERLMAAIKPLSDAIFALPPACVREDGFAVLTAGLRYFGPLTTVLAKGGAKLSRPFAELLDELDVTDVFIRRWLDMICFLLQGAACDKAPTSLMCYLLSDFYRPDVSLEYPKGGTKSIVDALVRGVEKFHPSNAVCANSKVRRVLVDDGNQRVAGVETDDGRVVKASNVISNADLWSTRSLIDQGACPQLEEYLTAQAARVRPCASFLHLHLGIDAAGLPSEPSEAFPAQWAFLKSWDLGVDAPRNLALVSVASMLDPALAPPGKHVVHAYVPATEPFEPWAADFTDGTGVYQSKAYRAAKEDAVQILWRAIEAYVPDVRQRVDVQFAATPLTHRRFLNKHRGTYGAFLDASTGQQLMGHRTPLPGFWLCGDSTFPGIGIPAVAASGTITANSILSPLEHWRVLDKIRL